MEQKGLHIFISGELVRAAEAMATSRTGMQGRPTSHSTCLILSMIAVKQIQSLGYRETDRLFKEAGYQNLPDFRTIQWRTERLRRNGLHMKISIGSNRSENRALLKLADQKEFVSFGKLGTRDWSKEIRDMRMNFVELIL